MATDLAEMKLIILLRALQEEWGSEGGGVRLVGLSTVAGKCQEEAQEGRQMRDRPPTVRCAAAAPT